MRRLDAESAKVIKDIEDDLLIASLLEICRRLTYGDEKGLSFIILNHIEKYLGELSQTHQNAIDDIENLYSRVGYIIRG